MVMYTLILTEAGLCEFPASPVYTVSSRPTQRDPVSKGNKPNKEGNKKTQNNKTNTLQRATLALAQHVRVHFDLQISNQLSETICGRKGD